MQTEEQRRQALEEATRRRQVGAAWKKDVRAKPRAVGIRCVAAVVRAQGGEAVGHLTLRAALTAAHGTGPAFARKVIVQTQLGPGAGSVRLRDLDARRAALVADHLLWRAEQDEARRGAPAEDPDRLFTVPEVAAFTGVSEQTIRQAIADGKLDAVRPLGPRSHFRIRRAAYMEWLGG